MGSEDDKRTSKRLRDIRKKWQKMAAGIQPEEALKILEDKWGSTHLGTGDLYQDPKVKERIEQAKARAQRRATGMSSSGLLGSPSQSRPSTTSANISDRKLTRQESWYQADKNAMLEKLDAIGASTAADAFIRNLLGYTDAYAEREKVLSEMGIVRLARSKLFGLINTRHERGSGKTTAHLHKSASFDSARSGHLFYTKNIIPDNIKSLEVAYETISASNPGTLSEVSDGTIYKIDSKKHDELYFVEDKVPVGDEGSGKYESVRTYLTFERQSIRSIASKIADGTYLIADGKVNIPGTNQTLPNLCSSADSNPRFIVIRDQVGEYYKIELNNLSDNLDHTGSSAPAKGLARRQSSFSRGGSLFDKYVAMSGYGNNLDSTLRLYPCEVRQFDNGAAEVTSVDTNPRIVCNNKQDPIKPDVDIQATLLPNTLPIQCYECVKYPNSGVKDYLINQLQIAWRNATSSKQTSTNISNLFRDAIKELKNKNPSDHELKLMGVATLTEIAMILVDGGQPSSEVKHGAEYGSPIFPEDIKVTEFVHPLDRRQKIVTHNEYELLSVLHNIPEILEDKVMFFNPIHFVQSPESLPAPWKPWRDDADSKKTIGKFYGAIERPCKNKEDEVTNIKLWKLLLEKQLYSFAMTRPNELEAFINTMHKNWDVQRAACKVKGGAQSQWNDYFSTGVQAADSVISHAREVIKNGTVNARLEEIAGSLQQTQQKDNSAHNSWENSIAYKFKAQSPHKLH